VWVRDPDRWVAAAAAAEAAAPARRYPWEDELDALGLAP